MTIVNAASGESASPDRDLRVAVIVINYNGGDMLLRCLHDLSRQTWTASKVIVVDNASADDSMLRAEHEFPHIHAIRLQENVGFAMGNNIGADFARECNWIACLNPDAYADPDWLKSLMEAAQAHPEFAMFGSKLILAPSPDRLDGTGDIYHVCGAAWRRDHGRKLAVGHDQAEEIFAPCAAAALYRRDAFDDAGGFDSDFFCFFEDVDLAFRMRLLGYRCFYVPSAIVHHVSSAITGFETKFSVYHGHRNLVWTFFKNMPRPLFVALLPLHIILNIVSIVLYAFKGKPLTILKSKGDAIRGLRSALRKRELIQSRRRVSSWVVLRFMKKDPFSLWNR